MNALEKRIIELSYCNHLTHVSSCLNTVNVLAEIYATRQPYDPVIVGNGHASLSHYVVLESIGMCDAQEMIEKHGVHASRDIANGIWCSNGALGQAETIAVGMALADRKRNVWLITSDGACAEGAVYESMRFAARNCPNLNVTVIFNGLGAYGETHLSEMPCNARVVQVDQARYPEFLRGLNGHYAQITEAQFKEIMQ